MPQTENLFPEDNISKPEGVAAETVYPPQNSGWDNERGKDQAVALKLISRSSRETVKYFDLVTENSASKSNGSDRNGRKRERILQGVDRNKKNGRAQDKAASAASRYFLPSAVAVAIPPSLTDDAQEWFAVLLVYLDQIVYIKEMKENLRNLEAAVNAGNIDAVNLIAHNSIGASAHCGMFKSIEILRRFERVGNVRRMPENAADLCRQIRQEFERFRFNLKENLEQMAINKQGRSLN